jgi:hypothetical protein
MLQQFGALCGVDERHVPLAHTHAAQQCIRDFVFGIDQGIADGVEVVVRHGRARVREMQEFSGCLNFVRSSLLRKAL